MLYLQPPPRNKYKQPNLPQMRWNTWISGKILRACITSKNKDVLTHAGLIQKINMALAPPKLKDKPTILVSVGTNPISKKYHIVKLDHFPQISG